MNYRLDDEMENSLLLRFEPFPLSRDVLCAFPAVGTVLRVMADQGNEKLGLHLLKRGRWVKFVNMVFELHGGLWHGLLMPSTKLRYLPNDDPLVLQSQRSLLLWVKAKSCILTTLLVLSKFRCSMFQPCDCRSYEERLSSKWARMPLSSFPWCSHITGFNVFFLLMVNNFFLLSGCEFLCGTSRIELIYICSHLGFFCVYRD